MNTRSDRFRQMLLVYLKFSHARVKTWIGTNYWWFLPGGLLILFFLWGINYQSRSAVTVNQVLFDLPRHNTTISLVFPRNLNYGVTTAQPVDISLLCSQPCDETPVLISLRSDSSILMADRQDAQEWGKTYRVSLVPNGGLKRFYVQPGDGKTGDAVIEIRADVFQTQFKGIHIESEKEAAKRLAALELWTRSSIAITILTALFGWLLKQREEDIRVRKENLEKLIKTRDALLEGSVQSQGLAEWLNEYQELTSNHPSRNEYEVVKKMLEDRTRRGQVLALLSKDFNNGFEKGKKTFLLLKERLVSGNPGGGLSSEADEYLKNLIEIIENNDLKLAYELLKSNRGKAAGLVFAAFKQDAKRADEFFEMNYNELIKFSSGDKVSTFVLPYLRAHYGKFTLNWYRVPYSLENYPLESRLLRSSWELDENIEDEKVAEWIKTQWGTEEGGEEERWRLSLSPFFDERNPLQVEKRPAEEPEFTVKYYNPDDDLGFQKKDAFHKPEHTLFLVQTAWEARASLAAFCRTIPDYRAGKDFPFVVYLQPGWFELDHTTPEEAVLHAVASQWIDILALNYYSFFDLEIDQRQRLSRLLLWHAANLPNLRALIEEAFQESKSKPGKEDSEYIFSEIQANLLGALDIPLSRIDLEALVSMRPKETTHTLLLVPSVSLTPGTGRELSVARVEALLGIADRLLERKVVLKGFILAGTVESLQTFIHTINLAFTPEQLVTSINRRFSYVFTGRLDDNERGLNFIFTPGKEPAERLLAYRAQGSPGRMVSLGRRLVAEHAQKFPERKYLLPKEISDLEC